MTDSSFAQLLRKYRRARALTQHDLATRSDLSARAVSDLERGVKQRPRTSTVRLLVRGLGLDERDADSLFNAAQPRDRTDRRAERPVA